MTGPRAAGADLDLVDRPNRRDLGGRADEEHFVGDVEHLARQVLLLAPWRPRSWASVMMLSRVMPGSTDAESGGV